MNPLVCGDWLWFPVTWNSGIMDRIGSGGDEAVQIKFEIFNRQPVSYNGPGLGFLKANLARQGTR